MKKDYLTAIDLCCGAGGWAVAARGLPIQFVAVVDFADDCLETWRVNHARHHPYCGRLRLDLTSPDAVNRVLEALEEAPDIVVGGIPCEQVSLARMCGGRQNACNADKLGEWHRLIDAVFTIVKRTRPRWWAIEDVIQAEKHLTPAIDLGFEIPVHRIQAADFGPQLRERSFFGVFPDPKPFADPGPRSLGECLRRGPHRTVAAAEGFRRLASGTGAGRVGNDAVRVLDPERPCWTVCGGLDRGSRQRRNFMVETADGRLRQLTWQEQAAVQGFPDDFLFAASQGRTCKMIGQAIPIQVGRAIFRAMCDGFFKPAE